MRLPKKNALVFFISFIPLWDSTFLIARKKTREQNVFAKIEIKERRHNAVSSREREHDDDDDDDDAFIEEQEQESSLPMMMMMMMMQTTTKTVGMYLLSTITPKRSNAVARTGVRRYSWPRWKA